jgi:16S rRNA (adenine1518-N6/adenine1519-N6)-dimethyltransferase
MGLSLKKSLGQHFLRDENISRKIVDALKERKVFQLLEVGPGGGALTKYLQTWKDVEFRAVELDKEKIDHILSTIPAMKGRIIHDDFLQMEKPFTGHFSIVGNFPYNISTQILFKIIGWRGDIEQMIGMFQKEVAQRAASKEGSKIYGVLSVLVQAFFDVEYLFEVPPSAFIPPPKVQSAVIRLIPKASALPYRSEGDFFALVKTAFNQRRKTLRNAARPLFTTEILQDAIFNKRAEQLSVPEFAQLTHRMNRNYDNN